MEALMSDEHHSSLSSSIDQHKLITPLNETITFRVEPTTISIFIDKLFMMVNDQNMKEWISWSDSGDSFFVFDIYDFSQVVLPQYFKHNKWSSFIRQLNTYGFCKVADYKSSNDKHTSEFKHPLFNRNGQHILHKIRRNMKQNIPESSLPLPPPLPPSSSSTSASSSSQHRKLRNISTITVDNLISVPRNHLNKNKENGLISIKSLTNVNDNLNNLTNHENMDDIIIAESPGKYSTICQKIENLQMDAEKLKTEITSLKQSVYSQQEIIEKMISSVLDKVDYDDHLTREAVDEKMNELLQSIKNFENFGEILSLHNIQSQQKGHGIGTIYDHTAILKPIVNHKGIPDLKSNNNYDIRNDDFNSEVSPTSANSAKLNK